MRWRLILSSAIALGVAAVAVHWFSTPRTPREFFEKRCSACHDLPDLSGYARHELAPLVQFMRTHNGASRVISDQEEELIIAYLEGTRRLGVTVDAAVHTPRAEPR